MTRVAIGADHAGFPLKKRLAEHLEEAGHEVVDLGTTSDESVDYPEYGAKVAHAVVDGQADVGVCVCGTGIGIAMAANKVSGARAAVVHDTTSARLARLHNNANVVCVGARLTGPEVAADAIDTFLKTEFEGGRHQRRIDQLADLESGGGHGS